MSDGNERLATGISGLDAILGGGLFVGGVFLLTGQPGSGKTILGNQICFAHGHRGGRAVYCTLLAETHGRMLANIRSLSFYDETLVGTSIVYIEGYATLEGGGFEAALKLLRDAVREQNATLLVIDGTVASAKSSPSDIAYKKFIQSLKSWIEVVDCTVVLLTSSGPDPSVRPEHTMVDGIVMLGSRSSGMQMLRELCVRKLRGGPHLEGSHAYAITNDGIVAWPRLEALLANPMAGELGDELVPFGIVELDKMLHGGLRRHSMTLVIGPPGVGKTQLALEFLANGTASRERCLYFGLFETPAVVADVVRRFGIAPDEGAAFLDVIWQPVAEQRLDRLATDLLRALDETGARRLVIDGMVAFKSVATDSDRLPLFFSALTNELRRRSVTTIMTEELRDVVNTTLYVPVDNVSSSFDNILFLRQSEIGGSIVRHLSAVKTRAAPHDHAPRRFEVTDTGIKVARVRDSGRARSVKSPKRGR